MASPAVLAVQRGGLHRVFLCGAELAVSGRRARLRAGRCEQGYARARRASRRMAVQSRPP